MKHCESTAAWEAAARKAVESASLKTLAHDYMTFNSLASPRNCPCFGKRVGESFRGLRVSVMIVTGGCCSPYILLF